jgi:hypothetical protein
MVGNDGFLGSFQAPDFFKLSMCRSATTNDPDLVLAKWVRHVMASSSTAVTDAPADGERIEGSYRRLPSSAINLVLLSLRWLSQATASFSAALTLFLALLPITHK